MTTYKQGERVQWDNIPGTVAEVRGQAVVVQVDAKVRRPVLPGARKLPELLVLPAANPRLRPLLREPDYTALGLELAA